MISNLLLKLRSLNEDEFVECIVGQPFTKEELKILQELVEKAIPEKTIIKHSGDEYYFCPNCNYEVRSVIKWAYDNYPYHADSGKTEYCPECGQKVRLWRV